MSGDNDYDPNHDSGTDTDDDGHLIQQAARTFERKQQESKVKRAPKRPAGVVTLKALIQEGLLAPAEDALTMEYKGTITHASLTADGRIFWEGMHFDSPSAFSIYLKRLVNPNRKADDGWKTVKYAGKYLEAYKVELLMRRYNEEQGEGGEGGDGDFPSKRPRMDAAAFAGCAPVLKQLAPRKHAGQAAAAAAARQAAAAAAGTASKASPSPEPGPTAREGFWLDNTPRPADLASQAVPEHDLAPKGGERGNANRQEVPRQQGAPPPVKHYMSGSDLEKKSNQSNASQADRPRRMVRAPERLASSLADKDPHDMVRCDAYQGVPGSGAPGAQPFKVKVVPCAELVMDFHAHLDKHEVIGLLAGTWDPATKVVRVERAFPVRESLGAAAAAGGTAGGGGAAAAGAAKDEGGARGGAGGSSSGNGSGNDHINVEMDSEDQFKVTEVIQQQYGLQVVGWYHSHPTFTPLPSLIDLGNQLMMQRNAGEEGTPGGEEPYIAAILSPYDSRLPSLQSAVTWFNVAYDKSKVSLDKDLLEQGCLPMELSVERAVLTDTSEVIIGLVAQLKALAARYARKRSSANLVAPWRPPPNDSTPPVSRLVKLLGSVCSWLPDNFTPHMRQTFRQLLELGIKDVRQSAGLPALEDDMGREADELLAGKRGGAAGQQGKVGLKPIAAAAIAQTPPAQAVTAPPAADAPGLEGAVPVTALGTASGGAAPQQPQQPLGQEQQQAAPSEPIGAAPANGAPVMVPI